MKDPKFSVIIPTYNRAFALDRALRSLENQTFKEFEVIVCDDGSTDDTKLVVDKYHDRFRLKYIWQENWGGPARPRNIAVQAAGGDWLSFLDADDYWHKDKLKKVNKFTDCYDVIYHSMAIVNEKGVREGSIVARDVDPDRPLVDLLVNGNKLANSGTSVRKELFQDVGGFAEDKRLVAIEDYDLWLRIALKASKFVAVQEDLGWYSKGSDQISRPSEKAVRNMAYLYEKFEKYLESPIDRVRVQQAMNYQFGIIYFVLDQKKDARQFFRRSYQCGFNKLALKSAIKLIRSYI